MSNQILNKRNRLYKIIKIDNKNYLFFSDLHIFHKNIFKYESIKRKKINKILELNIDDKEYWLLFYKKFSIVISNVIKTKNIYKTYNLGDFIFSPTQTKLEKLKDMLIDYDIFILGNHDLKDYQNKKISKTGLSYLQTNESYKKYFGKEETKLYDILKDKDTLYIITHHPIINTSSFYNFYWKELNMFLKELSFKNYKKGYKIINIHGHTHSNNVDNKLSYIQYLNVCIDNLV